MYFVYRFLNKTGQVIYVGKSKQSLNKRFSGHTHLPTECYKMVYKIEYIECSTESDMNIREIYYINKWRKNQPFFNLQDKFEASSKSRFTDEWIFYTGSLPEIFCNSVNFKKGYQDEVILKYTADGREDKRRCNKQKGVESFVEPLNADEVDSVVNYMIEQIAEAGNRRQEQIRFRNLVLFVLGVNLPIKSSELLNLKYNELFRGVYPVTKIKYSLNRIYQDIEIVIPLRENVRKLLRLYSETYNTNCCDSEEYVFVSQKHQVMTGGSWYRIISDVAVAMEIPKNIGAESIRKTYGRNIYERAENKLEALIFLEYVFGHKGYGDIIQYLDLIDKEFDFEKYFGEEFGLGKVNFRKLKKVLADNSKAF